MPNDPLVVLTVRGTLNANGTIDVQIQDLVADEKQTLTLSVLDEDDEHAFCRAMWMTMLKAYYARQEKVQ